MQPKAIAKWLLPPPLHHWGRRGYGFIRRKYLATVVGSSTAQKVVALTFDDGPNPDYTPHILDVLEKHGAKATFFVLGQNAHSHPELVQEIIRRGHVVGNHTFSHPRLSELHPLAVAQELYRCNRVIREAAGVSPVLMRPPQGAQRLSSYGITRLMGYKTVHWSASGDDWQGDSAEVVAGRILRKIKPGGIILLHDGMQPMNGKLGWQSGEREKIYDRRPTIEALEIILKQLGGEGYRFVTVTELMGMKPLIKKVWFV
jgi:peptidoglycan/xylan/chitin deacetylase (PgdA/CDA1 family)